jgi:caa(3)-type oxidase subunit IV
MDQALAITLWVFSGIFVGGVVTPLVTEHKQVSGWLSMLIGTVVGAIGNVVLLIPLWLVLWQTLPASSDHRVSWQRDAADWKQALAAPRSDAVTPSEMVAGLRRLLWPAARTDGHSHRASYVGVFVALAILTAVEVLLTVIDFGVSMAGPLVALSTTKVLLVALFFMHLRYDSRWYSSIFVYAFPFAALIVIILALAA